MRWIPILVCSAALAGGASVAVSQSAPGAAPVAAKPEAPKPLLPDGFAGWTASSPVTAATDPSQADPANTAALKEYGFLSAATASYKRESDTLTVRALRFQDTTGAYGAYSYYRQNGWLKAKIGTGAASNHNRVLFWQGDTVVDSTFSHLGPMSAGELRDLAAQLPVPAGTKALAPPVLANLPQSSIDPQTTHYAVGAAGYAGSGGVLPPQLIGFDRGAETVTADYSLTSGPATLTIIDYPTPQIAFAQEAAIRAYIKAGAKASPAWPKPLADSDTASLEVRRSGPLVALVSGDAVPDDSHKLIEKVHYDANLTSIPQPSESEISKTSKLLIGIAALVIVGSAAAILLGLFLGGGRALYRVARGRPASSVYDEDFVHLDLREERRENPKAIEGPHPKG